MMLVTIDDLFSFDLPSLASLGLAVEEMQRWEGWLGC